MQSKLAWQVFFRGILLLGAAALLLMALALPAFVWLLGLVAMRSGKLPLLFNTTEDEHEF